MALLKKPGEVNSVKKFKVLIYGQPGIGKTTLALSADNPVLIDLDQGMDRVDPRFQVPSLQAQNYGEVLSLLQSNEINEFRTIVIDTLGKLVDMMAEHIIKTNSKMGQRNGALTQQGYGVLKSEFRSFFKLVASKNKSIIFVAHEAEKREKDSANEDITVKRPDVVGSSGKELIKELDIMGYMQMRGNKRSITFSPQENAYAKNSLGIDDYLQVPDIKSGNNFMQTAIFDVATAQAKEKIVMKKAYDDLISTYKEAIELLATSADLNESFKTLGEAEHVWDSKMVIWKLLQAKSKELKLTYDKDTKKFIKPEVVEEVPEVVEEKTEEKKGD